MLGEDPEQALFLFLLRRVNKEMIRVECARKYDGRDHRNEACSSGGAGRTDREVLGEKGASEPKQLREQEH